MRLQPEAYAECQSLLKSEVYHATRADVVYDGHHRTPLVSMHLCTMGSH